MSYSELKEARILANVREENPWIEDQLFDDAQYDFIDSFQSYHSTQFLIRNLDAVDAELLSLALYGHPDRLKYRIRLMKKTSKEYRSFYVELLVKPTSNKRPIEVIKECFQDLEQLFKQINCKADKALQYSS